MNYQGFAGDGSKAMCEAVRGALASDDALEGSSSGPWVRVRQTRVDALALKISNAKVKVENFADKPVGSISIVHRCQRDGIPLLSGTFLGLRDLSPPFYHQRAYYPFENFRGDAL